MKRAHPKPKKNMITLQNYKVVNDLSRDLHSIKKVFSLHLLTFLLIKDLFRQQCCLNLKIYLKFK